MDAETADVYALRESVGFTSPLEPIREGKPWCLFESRGTMEFLLHPADAERYLRDGVVVDGVRCECEWVEDWPLMGGRYLAAHVPGANQVFTPDVRKDGGS
jgi:hypothetical protein